jgi:predicted HAD superfamily hydrolase
MELLLTKGNKQRHQATIKLYSFDVFDTLVTRTVATPVGIFAIMQEILAQVPQVNDFVRKNFYRLRIDTEIFARRNIFRVSGQHEISFDEIYAMIQSNYNLTDEETEFLKELEITTEINNLIPIDETLNTLRALLAENNRVILVSDMYFGEKYLKQILSHIDPIFNDIKIYSSADYKTSKGDGKLYSIIKDLENVEYKEWKHFGDNKSADIKKAKEFGIQTAYLPQVQINRYENIFLKKTPNVYHYATIGSSKLARRHKIAQNQDKYDFGASFAGPILYNYVEWLLEQALERGFEVLYFIARDGYIPKIIADVIIKERNLPIKTKYLYGSRLAWRKLAQESYDQIIEAVFKEYSYKLTPEFLGYRLNVDPNKIAKLLGVHSVKTKISSAKAEKYIKIFQEEPSIKSELLEANRESVEILKKYLQQEIDLTKDNIAFVDIFGSGRTQDCIANILNGIKPCKLYGFYLVFDECIQQKENSVKFAYFATIKPWLFFTELLCRTTEGQTIGYKDNGDKIEPITEQGYKKEMLNWGFYEYIEGIKNYAKNMLNIEKANNMKFNTLDLFCEYNEYLNLDLDRQTANILGTLPYLAIGKEEQCSVSAPKIHTLQLLSSFILCKKNKICTVFPSISYARSSKSSKKLQNALKKCPTLQKFLFNIYVNRKKEVAYIRILGIKISFRRLIWRNKNV